MEVEVSHVPEENQPKTLCEEYSSFMEEIHQITKVQDEIENCTVKKEVSLLEATRKSSIKTGKYSKKL